MRRAQSARRGRPRSRPETRPSTRPSSDRCGDDVQMPKSSRRSTATERTGHIAQRAARANAKQTCRSKRLRRAGSRTGIAIGVPAKEPRPTALCPRRKRRPLAAHRATARSPGHLRSGTRASSRSADAGPRWQLLLGYVSCRVRRATRGIRLCASGNYDPDVVGRVVGAHISLSPRTEPMPVALSLTCSASVKTCSAAVAITDDIAPGRAY
jgi:hypothetical protein